MFTIIILILVLIPVAVVFFTYKQQQNVKVKYPEPPGNFLFGHILDVISTRNMINIVSKWTTEYGKIVHLKFGPSFAPLKTGLVTTDYKFVEFILSSNKILTKAENYKFFKPWLGEGLFVTDSHIWKKHRKILTPAFHFEILKEFVSVFESVGNALIEKLGEKADCLSLDLHPFMSLCALDIICETAMGTKIHALEGENSDYVESVKRILNITLNRIASPLKIYEWSFRLTKDFYIQKKLLKIIHKFTLDVIDKANKESLNRNNKNEKKMAFLDLLIKYSKHGKLLNYDEIREEVDTFMFAGHDTTATGICYTLFCLADNPEIQEKVLKEQKELFGDEKNPKITFQELQNMKYLDLVIKESLRYYPVVPGIGRYVKEDIEFDGTIIPKHTNIFIFIYGMLRDPEYFPEPEKFNPERFNTINNLPFAYIPFSAGPRNCIGKKYALLEMKSLISKVIRHFELVPAIPRHNFEFAAELVLKSLNGIKVGIKRRM